MSYIKFFLDKHFFYRPEYGAFWKCVQVGGMYMLTQLCKMLILATFFPTYDGPPESASLFTVSKTLFFN